MRRVGFVGRFLLGWLALGVVASVAMYVDARLRSRKLLGHSIPAVRFENVELGTALQQLADTTKPSIHLSMCPDVASSRLTLTTTGEMPLKDFAVLVASKVRADVDLAHSRHGGGSSPHFYFARAPCGTRGFVNVYKRQP
jgi:hypothetical protein